MSSKEGEKLRKAADFEEKTRRQMEIKQLYGLIWIATILSRIADYLKAFLFSSQNPDTYNETMPIVFKSEKEIETISKRNEEAAKPLHERDILRNESFWD